VRVCERERECVCMCVDECHIPQPPQPPTHTPTPTHPLPLCYNQPTNVPHTPSITIHTAGGGAQYPPHTHTHTHRHTDTHTHTPEHTHTHTYLHHPAGGGAQFAADSDRGAAADPDVGPVVGDAGARDQHHQGTQASIFVSVYLYVYLCGWVGGVNV
jgi:hypothetical protein